MRKNNPAARITDPVLLAEAVAQATSLSQAVRNLGLRPDGKRLKIARRVIDEYNISTAHFGSRPAPELIAEIVRSSSTLSEVIRALGLSITNGSSHRLVKAWIIELGIDTSHFTGSGWNRGLQSNARRTAADILRRRPEGSIRETSFRLRRALLEVGVPEICAECGGGPVWNGKPLQLQIDHIDGDGLNDEQSNLRFLCPNCHSQTPTYGNKKR
jgi:hypothetical protein